MMKTLQVTQIGYRGSSPRLIKFRFYVKGKWMSTVNGGHPGGQWRPFIHRHFSCVIFNCRSYSLTSVFSLRRHIYIFPLIMGLSFSSLQEIRRCGISFVLPRQGTEPPCCQGPAPTAWPPLQTAAWRSRGGWGPDPDKADESFGKFGFLWACESKDWFLNCEIHTNLCRLWHGMQNSFQSVVFVQFSHRKKLNRMFHCRTKKNNFRYTFSLENRPKNYLKLSEKCYTWDVEKLTWIHKVLVKLRCTWTCHECHSQKYLRTTTNATCPTWLDTTYSSLEEL